MMSRLVTLWWYRIPRTIARASPTLAMSSLDGSYLSLRPAAGALAPPIAAVVGLLVGAFHPGPTFTRSTVVMVVLAAVGFAGAALGLAALVGYAVGDLFLHTPVSGVSGVDRWVPLLITYGVLAFVMVLAPSGTASIRAAIRSLESKVSSAVAVALSVATSTAIAGLLVYAWVRSAAVLVRPVFTWHGDQPSVPDISPLQTGRVWWLVVVTVAVTVARSVVEEKDRLARKGDPRVQALAMGIALRAHALATHRVRRTAAIVGTGVIIAMLLSGMIDGVVQGVLVAIFFAAVLAGRDALSRSRVGVVRSFQKVPAVVRFAVAFLLARQVVDWVMGQAWESGSTATFEPLLYATCSAAAIVTLLSGQRPRPELDLFADDIGRRSG